MADQRDMIAQAMMEQPPPPIGLGEFSAAPDFGFAPPANAPPAGVAGMQMMERGLSARGQPLLPSPVGLDQPSAQPDFGFAPPTNAPPAGVAGMQMRGRRFAHMPWWPTFVANVGPEAAALWAAQQEQEGGGSEGEPQPQDPGYIDPFAQNTITS